MQNCGNSIRNLSVAIIGGTILFGYLYLESKLALSGFLVGLMNWLVIPVAVAAIGVWSFRGAIIERFIWTIVVVVVAAGIFGVTLSDLRNSISLSYLLIYTFIQMISVVIAFAILEGIMWGKRRGK